MDRSSRPTTPPVVRSRRCWLVAMCAWNSECRAGREDGSVSPVPACWGLSSPTQPAQNRKGTSDLLVRTQGGHVLPAKQLAKIMAKDLLLMFPQWHQNLPGVLSFLGCSKNLERRLLEELHGVVESSGSSQLFNLFLPWVPQSVARPGGASASGRASVPAVSEVEAASHPPSASARPPQGEEAPSAAVRNAPAEPMAVDAQADGVSRAGGQDATDVETSMHSDGHGPESAAAASRGTSRRTELQTMKEEAMVCHRVYQSPSCCPLLSLLLILPVLVRSEKRWRQQTFFLPSRIESHTLPILQVLESQLQKIRQSARDLEHRKRHQREALRQCLVPSPLVNAHTDI